MGSLFATIAMLAAGPAGRAASQIPEPSDFALFALGVAGLLIGRRAAMKRKGGSDKD